MVPGSTLLRLGTVMAAVVLTCRISAEETLCDEFFYLVHSQFTLHGLWPNYQRGHCPGKPGAWPQNCDESSTDLPPECDCPFQQELIADLTPVMSVDWPGYGYSNAEFWKHEWDKHGSCAITYEKAVYGPVTEEHAYFAKTLELHNQCNVLESLAAAGIHPGSHASAQNYIAAIKQGCGVEPQLACHYRTADLQEVRVCYDDQFAAIDCQQAKQVEDCSGTSLLLPVWKQDAATS